MKHPLHPPTGSHGCRMRHASRRTVAPSGRLATNSRLLTSWYLGRWMAVNQFDFIDFRTVECTLVRRCENCYRRGLGTNQLFKVVSKFWSTLATEFIGRLL